MQVARPRLHNQPRYVKSNVSIVLLDVTEKNAENILLACLISMEIVEESRS